MVRSTCREEIDLQKFGIPSRSVEQTRFLFFFLRHLLMEIEKKSLETFFQKILQSITELPFIDFLNQLLIFVGNKWRDKNDFARLCNNKVLFAQKFYSQSQVTNYKYS